MTPFISIETTHGGIVFPLAYVAAFLLAAGILGYHGVKKGYPLNSWLLIMLTGVFFFITGEKVGAFSPAQWLTAFTEMNLPGAHEKNAFGGIIGLVAGMFLAKTMLGFKRPVFDALAIALPISLAISRIGCLMTGCCYGIPTTMPFGLIYGAESLPWQAQLAQGLIDAREPFTRAIHPVQVYQVAGGLFIAFIVWRSRRVWKAPGSMFLFSVLCYGFIRFFVEFLVDPSSNSFAVPVLLGMSQVQWLIIAAFFPGLLALVIRESAGNRRITQDYPVTVAASRRVMLTMLLCALLFLGRHWFDFLEFTTILLFLVPVVAMLLAGQYCRYSVAGYRLVLPVVLVCCISFMAQKSQPQGNETEETVFTEAGLIGMIGSYYENVSRVDKVYVGDGCKGAYVKSTNGHYENFLYDLGTSKQQFWQTGVDVSRNKWVGKYQKRSIGGRFFIGSETGDYSTDYPHSELYLGVSPYINFDWKNIGFGTGFSLGQMKLQIGNKDKESYSDEDIVTRDYNNVYFLPALSVRFGPVDILYFEASFPGLFPSSSPYPLFKAGIGTGLGKSNGTKASVGYCDGLYAQVKYPIRDKVVVEALYADNLHYGAEAKRMLSVGISYRFPKVTRTRPSRDQAALNEALPGIAPGMVAPVQETVSDADSNVYAIVKIDGRMWMAENLNVSHYRNGKEIEGIKGNDLVPGKQYPWPVVRESGNLCPVGWHVPSIAEWTSLYASLGGETGGVNNLVSAFTSGTQVDHWWSATETKKNQAKSFYLNQETIGILVTDTEKNTGLSVRCVKDL